MAPAPGIAPTHSAFFVFAFGKVFESLETFHTVWYCSIIEIFAMHQTDVGMWFSQRSGWVLVGIGLLHCAIGVLLSWGIFVDWHATGWWHSIETAQGMHMDRFAALWFQVSGLSWVLLGWLMQQWLVLQGALPKGLGWALMAMGFLVAVVLPVSGAWLFLPLGWLVAMPRRAATAQA